MYNVSFKINYDKFVRHSVIIALMAEHRNLVSQLTVVKDCKRIKKQIPNIEYLYWNTITLESFIKLTIHPRKSINGHKASSYSIKSLMRKSLIKNRRSAEGMVDYYTETRRMFYRSHI